MPSRYPTSPSVFFTAAVASPPSKLVTPASQGVATSGWAFSHSVGRLVGILALEDLIHQRVFHRQVEFQVGDELADIRALIGIAGADIGVDVGGAETRVAHAVEIGDLHLAHDRMRGPAEEDDPILPFMAFSACDSMPASEDFHELEAVEAVVLVVDHPEHDAVAVVARLDAIDLAVELVLELADVLEALDPAVIDIVGTTRP